MPVANVSCQSKCWWANILGGGWIQHIPMTEPWDERYMYLLIYHTNSTIHGSKYTFRPMDQEMGYKFNAYKFGCGPIPRMPSCPPGSTYIFQVRGSRIPNLHLTTGILGGGHSQRFKELFRIVLDRRFVTSERLETSNFRKYHQYLEVLKGHPFLSPVGGITSFTIFIPYVPNTY